MSNNWNFSRPDAFATDRSCPLEPEVSAAPYSSTSSSAMQRHALKRAVKAGKRTRLSGILERNANKTKPLDAAFY